MTKIVLRPAEHMDAALRRFKRAVEHAGIMLTLRTLDFYEKSTSARKRKKSAAIKRTAKRISAQSIPPKLY